MIINTPISVGELMDKISILTIKKLNITDEKKLSFICDELSLLESTLANFVTNKRAKKYISMLVKINSHLWKVEDEIRECERNKKFDKKFIDLAREVYTTNDKRSAIKLEINNFFGSTLVEVKSYEKY